MILERKLYRIKKLIVSYLAYKKHLRKYECVEPARDKAIVLTLSDYSIFDRYFYNFAKFFDLSGYSIYFPDFNWMYYRKYLHNKRSSIYFDLIFEDKLLHYNKPPKSSIIQLKITNNYLNPDYFSSTILKKRPLKNSFVVPVSMHPLFYYKGYWNEEIDFKEKRKQSIFMAGNFDKKHYSQINETPFQVESRIAAFNHLKKRKLLSTICTKTEFQNFLESTSDYSCILLDRAKVSIPIQNLRRTISYFNFYLALPGIFMPFCHNLIEALSVGAIPIIHKEYAGLMKPELKHMKNAIVYNDLQDLELKISIAYKMDKDMLEIMRENVFSYYLKNLTPSSVVEKIVNNNYSSAYLQAQRYSLKLLEQNKEKLL